MPAAGYCLSGEDGASRADVIDGSISHVGAADVVDMASSCRVGFNRVLRRTDVTAAFRTGSPELRWELGRLKQSGLILFAFGFGAWLLLMDDKDGRKIQIQMCIRRGSTAKSGFSSDT